MKFHEFIPIENFTFDSKIRGEKWNVKGVFYTKIINRVTELTIVKYSHQNGDS